MFPKAYSRAKPEVVAAKVMVASYIGMTTVTSIAASLPLDQCGTRMSAGRRSLPGKKNLPSLVGGTKPGSYGCVVKGLSQGIVAADPLTP